MREDLIKVTEDFNSKLSQNDVKKIEEVIEETETILFASATRLYHRLLIRNLQ